MNSRQTTPRLCAEWEPQSAVMLVWPDEESDWQQLLDNARKTYLEIIAAIAMDQQVILIIRNSSQSRFLSEQFSRLGIPEHRVNIVESPYNDSWIRDFGPLSLHDGFHYSLLNFRFNAWGGKYEYAQDDKVISSLSRQGLFDCELRESGLVLEGGAIETDGQGTLLATLGSTVTESRNPGVDLNEMEEELRNTLGIEHFHWLESTALPGDDTDGHIDTLARFVDAETIAYASAGKSDPDYLQLSKLKRELQALRKTDGTPYRLIPLPSPGVHLGAEGQTLPATYANFLIINNQVLVPVYNVENDTLAVDRIQRCFPTRKITAIDCRSLITQNGSLHCATMQLSAGCFSRTSTRMTA